MEEVKQSNILENKNKFYKKWWFLVLLVIIIGGLIMYVSSTFNSTTLEPSSLVECGQLFGNNPDELYLCYQKLGIKRADISICDLIPINNVGKIICYAGVSLSLEDAETCNYIDDGYKQNCIQEIANECSCLSYINDEHLTFCDKIKNKGVIGTCE